MYVLGIPLNMMTAMIGALVIGIGIDYPIHVSNRWAQERRAGKTREKCYLIAMRTTGREVSYSAVTTGVAFWAFLIMPVEIMTQFGIVMLFGIIYSLGATVLVLPMMLAGWHKEKRK